MTLTADELRGFLGVGDGHDGEIERVLASATETICRATGIDWTRRDQNETFNEAVRTQVWLSWYAVRDEAKNTQFLQEYLIGLICSLQLCKSEVARNDLR